VLRAVADPDVCTTSQWADSSSVGEGEMGTNVVWMYPQLWQAKESGSDPSKAHRTHLADGELLRAGTGHMCSHTVYACARRRKRCGVPGGDPVED
jgi:hypothetical protein